MNSECFFFFLMKIILRRQLGRCKFNHQHISGLELKTPVEGYWVCRFWFYPPTVSLILGNVCDTTRPWCQPLMAKEHILILRCKNESQRCHRSAGDSFGLVPAGHTLILLSTFPKFFLKVAWKFYTKQYYEYKYFSYNGWT
jgi:hypothetical protein